MVFEASHYHINKAIEAKDLKQRPLEEIVSKQYHEFLSLFSKILADWLQPYQPGIDHEVPLKAGESPRWGSLYLMSRVEFVVLQQ